MNCLGRPRKFYLVSIKSWRSGLLIIPLDSFSTVDHKLPSTRFARPVNQSTLLSAESTRLFKAKVPTSHVQSTYENRENHKNRRRPSPNERVFIRKTERILWDLGQQPNELCQIVLFTDNASVQEERDGIVEVPVGDVLKPPKSIITNAICPKHSCGDSHKKARARFRGVESLVSPPPHRQEEYSTGILVCRWKKSIQWASTRGNHMPYWSEISLTRMTEADVQNPSLRELDDQLRMDFRGPTSLGGSETAPSTDERMMDSLHSPAQPKTLSPSTRNLPIASLTLVENGLAPGRQYFFGDSFCGAGGVSRGAKMAGLAMKWAFDKWDSAMQSYCSISPGWTVDSLRMNGSILRLSPPCQPFSPAKTVVISSDEENQAALCSVMDSDFLFDNSSFMNIGLWFSPQRSIKVPKSTDDSEEDLYDASPILEQARNRCFETEEADTLPISSPDMNPTPGADSGIFGDGPDAVPATPAAAANEQ
ncbi:MAG: hypothetical protein M1814_005329 [Vezdaea aestivalis]|nr:MAG: hypothetical protein M1814_005329 [Vezdaea aestivalis]